MIETLKQMRSLNAIYIALPHRYCPLLMRSPIVRYAGDDDRHSVSLVALDKLLDGNFISGNALNGVQCRIKI